jgi:hypothetical protein
MDSREQLLSRRSRLGQRESDDVFAHESYQ